MNLDRNMILSVNLGFLENFNLKYDFDNCIFVYY